MENAQMPIFTRTFDFLVWLLQATNHFPRAQRQTVTSRLLGAALDLRETLEIANHLKGQARLEKLHAADQHLNLVRFYLRLAENLSWLSPGQYQHAVAMASEIGRLLGGWLKVTR